MATDLVEIVMEGISAADPTYSKPIANVYHFQRVVGTGAASKSQINTVFQSSIGDIVLLALNVDYTQTFNKIRFFDDALDAYESFVQAGVGAVAGERCPDYVTATVRLTSPFRTRSGRGRKSYSPITEVSTTGDNLAAGAITLFTNVANAILAGFTDAGGNTWTPIIKQMKAPAQYTVNPVNAIYWPVTSTSVNTNLGVLKRRKIKV